MLDGQALRWTKRRADPIHRRRERDQENQHSRSSHRHCAKSGTAPPRSLQPVGSHTARASKCSQPAALAAFIAVHYLTFRETCRHWPPRRSSWFAPAPRSSSISRRRASGSRLTASRLSVISVTKCRLSIRAAVGFACGCPSRLARGRRAAFSGAASFGNQLRFAGYCAGSARV